MVLRANYAKRAEDQNQPPATDAKAGASRTRATAHDAARRRRQRNNGTTSNYAVEQAARRSQLKHTPRQLRFNVTTITTPPPQTDVEMRDAEPLAPAAVTTVPVVLPRNLPRLQDYSEVTREAMEAVHLGNGVDTIYALERLDTPSLLKVLRSTKGITPINQGVLPKEVRVIVTDTTNPAPTHMLAVHGLRKTSPQSKTNVTLYPVHDVVLAANCPNLPPFPPVSISDSNTARHPEVTLPVRALCLPSPQTYPQLSHYLYVKSPAVFYGAPFLPTPLPASLHDTTDQEDLIPHAASLAQTYTAQALLNHVATTHGLWQNLCALGITDLPLWQALDTVWEVLLLAIAIGTGNPELIIFPEFSEDPATSDASS